MLSFAVSLPYVKLLLPQTCAILSPCTAAAQPLRRCESHDQLSRSSKQPAVPAKAGERVCDCSLNVESTAPSLG